MTVQYATADVTAKAGTDYQKTSGTLTFAPGTTSQTINVPVIGIPAANATKTFDLILSSPVGATLAQTQAVGTIVDQAPPPAANDFQFAVTSDWGSGFDGQITVVNSMSTPLMRGRFSSPSPVRLRGSGTRRW